MAPSRGINPFIWARRALACNTSARRYSRFAEAAVNSSNKSQIYISRSSNPYLNLSIEHYLLQKTPVDSTILFLYTNKPCIVIGRNQNPWMEVNLGLLRTSPFKVSLVRRRSGGGSVFHDEGNVNYSVICPTPVFNRDKHAKMVVRALRSLGVKQARVNERHDIVVYGANGARPLKISGSAYKLTRFRSLHHGTCLLSSPYIEAISQYLRSPARPYIKGQGVESVNSPIANVHVPNQAFEEAVVSEFGDIYGGDGPVFLNENSIEGVADISKGLGELTSLDWIYGQTPRFNFSTHKTEEDVRERPPQPSNVPLDFKVTFAARFGKITSYEIQLGSARGTSREQPMGRLIGSLLHETQNWTDLLSSVLNSESENVTAGQIEGAGKWMKDLLCV